MQGTKRRIIDHRDLTDHEKKNLMILEIIRRKGPIARADVARLVDLNNVTVTSYVDQYLRKKILHEAGVQLSTGGRKPTLVDLDPSITFSIGVGIHSSDLIAILCDVKGKIIKKVKLVDHERMRSALPDLITEGIEQLLKETNVDKERVHGIGIGVPGVVNQNTGTVRWPKGMLTGDIAIASSISNLLYQKFDIPVIVDNDANTAVFAEQWALPNGLNVESAAYLYSGAGCGLMVGGNIYRGFTGSAGEFLFNLSQEDPIAWLERSISSGDGIIDLGMTAMAKKNIAEHKDSLIYELSGGDPSKIMFSSVVQAAEKNDAFAVSLARDAGKLLGFRVAQIINLINPELVIIGGGMETAGIVFMDAIKKCVKEIALPEASERTRIVPSQLGEDAVPLGAAALVIQNFFTTN